nr:hypothetical protein [Crucivirus sp.]
MSYCLLCCFHPCECKMSFGAKNAKPLIKQNTFGNRFAPSLPFALDITQEISKKSDFEDMDFYDEDAQTFDFKKASEEEEEGEDGEVMVGEELFREICLAWVERNASKILSEVIENQCNPKKKAKKSTK